MIKDKIFRGEIFYADLGEKNGSVQCGERPVLIIQNNIGNAHSPTTIIAPITSQLAKRKMPTHVFITGGGLEKASIILLEQVRTINCAKLTGYIGQADKTTMCEVDKALKISLGLS